MVWRRLVHPRRAGVVGLDSLLRRRNASRSALEISVRPPAFVRESLPCESQAETVQSETLRSSAASLVVNRSPARPAMPGIDLVTLAAMLGHSRIQMVLRHAHPMQEHQTKAMEQLERFNAEQQIAALERQSAMTQ